MGSGQEFFVVDSQGRGAADTKRGVDLVVVRRALRRHWRAVLAFVVAGLLASLVWATFQTELYASDASGIVSTGATENVGLSVAADNLAKSKATQYKVLAESPVVRDAALKKAGLEPGPGSISVAVPLDTPEIRFRVVRDDPFDAARLADAYVEALGDSVSDIENQSLPGAESSPRTSGAVRSVVRVVPLLKAEANEAPSYPPTPLALAAGALLGLLLGLTYTAARTIFDRRVRNVAVLEEDLGLSVVGLIPVHGGQGSRRLVGVQDARRIHDKNKPAMATNEAFKALRTNLRFMNPDHPPRVIAVTSPLPAEGKSTVAANLAETVAASGDQVILIDGDLRRPTVATSFDLIEGVGLTDVVVGRARVDEVLQDVSGTPNLKVLAAGPVPPNPSEILSSDRFKAVIDELAETAMIIIDAPPVLPVTDAAILSARFDGALLVVHAGSSTIDEIQRALMALERVHAKVLGAVLNRVPTSKGDGGGYGYYGHYYYSSNAAEVPATVKALGATGDGSSGGEESDLPQSRTSRRQRKSRRSRAGG